MRLCSCVMTATSLGPSTNQIQPYLPDLVLFTKMVRFRLPFQNMIFRGNIQCVRFYQANEAVRCYRDTHNNVDIHNQYMDYGSFDYRTRRKQMKVRFQILVLD